MRLPARLDHSRPAARLMEAARSQVLPAARSGRWRRAAEGARPRRGLDEETEEPLVEQLQEPGQVAAQLGVRGAWVGGDRDRARSRGGPVSQYFGECESGSRCWA